MSIDPKLFLSNFPAVSLILGLLIIGKTLVVTFIGRVFGVSTIAVVRVGLLFAPGGDFDSYVPPPLLFSRQAEYPSTTYFLSIAYISQRL